MRSPFASKRPIVVCTPWSSSPSAAVIVNEPTTKTPPGTTLKLAYSTVLQSNRPRCGASPAPVSLLRSVFGSSVGDRWALPTTRAANGRSWAAADAPAKSVAAIARTLATNFRDIAFSFERSLLRPDCTRDNHRPHSLHRDRPRRTRQGGGDYSRRLSSLPFATRAVYNRSFQIDPTPVRD